MNESSTRAGAPLVNLANMLTIARIALVPVFLCLVLVSDLEAPGWRFAACAVFVVASATDFVDGWVARTWDMVTAFGKIADPIADKALTGTALVLLSSYGLVAWWITLVILARELGITLLRLSVLRHGVIPASRGGKIKTALQILAISWYLLPLPESAAAGADWVMALAVVVALVTGADYVVRALRLRAGAGQTGAGQTGAVSTGAVSTETEPVEAEQAGELPGDALAAGALRDELLSVEHRQNNRPVASARFPIQSQSGSSVPSVVPLTVPGVPTVQVSAQEEAAS